MLTPRRFFPLLALLALALAPAACSSGPEERDPEELFTLYRESAFYYWQAADFERAEAQATNALAIHPDDKSSNLILANLSLLRGTTKDLMSAQQRYRSMADQEDFRVQLGLGEVLERLGMVYDEAATAIETGQRSTEAPDPVARVAELRQLASDAWQEATEHFHQVLAERTNNPSAVNGLQRVMALEGDLEGALVWTNRLLDLVDIDLSYYRSKLDRPDITPEEEARQRDRMNNSLNLAEQTYLLGASMLHELGRDEAELEYLDKAAEISPKTPEIWSRKAQAQMRLEQYAEAIHSLDTYLELSGLPFDSPDVQQAYEYRDQCERKKEEAEVAARMAELGTIGG